MCFRAVLIFQLVFLSSGPSLASVITRCGASAGTAFQLKTPFLPGEDAGWRQETLSRGSL